ncbi:hypothetical protein [Streptomyces sp. NPDC005438]|uniref:DNA-binding protein NsdB n=1 Tax=Streptomyces sp. NPDC005438 TaxID=3156880 RepID=UPI0033B637DA
MTKGPNTHLADLFRLTGWSKGELARLVNRQAGAMGHTQLSTDTSRVRRWIDMGESPRDPVPKVLAYLFTERLGRVVTVEDLGFGRAGRSGARQSVDDLPWPPERTTEVLTEFTGMDLMLNRRGLMGAGAVLTSGSAIGNGLSDWLTAPAALPAQSGHGAHAGQPSPVSLRPDQARYGRVEATPVGYQEIEALEHSVEVFRAWDASRGGGLQRKAVVGQLNEVGGMLSYRHPERLQRRLWGVAANLAVLAGWMSHDVGLEPTAQKYFVIATHAARESGDRPRTSEALSRAARQMVHVGRPEDALDLMRLAYRAGGPLPPKARAMLRTIEAWARASLGQAEPTRRALGEAEEAYVQEGYGEPTPSWMQLFDEADLYGMQALAFRTLAEHEPSAARSAQRHARRALELRPGGRQRSKIFDHLSLAGACLISEDPEQADRYVRLALLTINENSSHRTWDRLRDTQRLTEPYARHPRIAELREEIDLALPRPNGRGGTWS